VIRCVPCDENIMRLIYIVQQIMQNFNAFLGFTKFRVFKSFYIRLIAAAILLRMKGGKCN
jgi:hypothetical protein